MTESAAQTQDNLAGLILNKRFRIMLDRVIPKYSGRHYKAFVATDLDGGAGNYYACVSSPELPTNFTAIKAIQEAKIQNINNILDYGTVFNHGAGTSQNVVVFDMLDGQSLADFFANMKSPIRDMQILINDVISPLNDAVSGLANAGYSHSRINPANIYWQRSGNNSIKLRQSLMDPAGLDQHYIYESLDSFLASEYGKGYGNSRRDNYALALIIFRLMTGVDLEKKYSPEDWFKYRIEHGTAMIIGDMNIQDNFKDFFRGMLNDRENERWGSEELTKWLDGKNFNLIQPLSSRDAPRPYVFNEQQYVGRKSLALAFAQNWKRAAPSIRERHFLKWLETANFNKDWIEKLSILIKSTGGDRGFSAEIDDELISKTITMIDTNAPIRYRSVAAYIDSLGLLLAKAYAEGDVNMIKNITALLLAGHHEFWMEHYGSSRQKSLLNANSNLQKARTALAMNGLGFSRERLLYEINPDLSCRSKSIAIYNAKTIAECLQALEEVAKSKNRPESPIDEHIACFLAARLDLKSQLRMPALDGFGEMAKDKSIINLALLSKAQGAAKHLVLPNLCGWMAENMWTAVNYLYNNKVKIDMMEKLNKAAQRGKMQFLIDEISNPKVLIDDHEGFLKASRHYAKNVEKLSMLTDSKHLGKLSEMRGLQASFYLALFAFVATVLVFGVKIL